jgi:hypothetical protein
MLTTLLLVWGIPYYAFASADTNDSVNEPVVEAYTNDDEGSGSTDVVQVDSDSGGPEQATNKEDAAETTQTDTSDEAELSEGNEEQEATASEDTAAQNQASGEDAASTTQEATQQGGAVITAQTAKAASIMPLASDPKQLSDYLNSLTLEVQATCGKYHKLEGNKLAMGSNDEPVHDGDAVKKNAGVYVLLKFDTISGLSKGAVLTYQFPEGLFDGKNATNGTVYDANHTNEPAATYTLDDKGLLTVELSDQYFDDYKQSDNTIDLHGFQFEFWGAFSPSRGEDGGDSDDAVFQFAGKSTANADDFKYTVPFEYLNYHSQVNVSKSHTYDAATRTITYTITASTPSGNTKDATNVKVVDTFSDASNAYLSDTYELVSKTTGDFSKGTWTIGTMKPGETQTLVYTAKISSNDYFTKQGSITNSVLAKFNTDGKSSEATDELENAGTLIIDKSNATINTGNDGNIYLTYTLTVNAYGADIDNVVVKDLFDHSDVIDSYTQADGSPSQGTMATTASDTGTTMKWTVGMVKVGTPAKLQYKVKVNNAAWEKNYTSKVSNTYSGVSQPNGLKLALTNTASVYTSDGSNEVLYDSASAKTEISKALIYKSGNVNTTDGSITYTVDVNKPNNGMCDNISFVQDTLSTGSYVGDSVTLNVYNPDGTSVASLEVPLSKIYVSGSNNRSWKIELDKVPTTSDTTGLSTNSNGTVNVASTSATPYYYQLSYKASGLGYLTNTADVGYGTGTQKTTRSMTVGKSTTSFSYVKNYTLFDINEGLASWKITINSTIPKDSGIEDVLTPSGTCGAKCGCSYYTKEQIDALEIKQGETTFKNGTDYEILEYSQHSEAADGHSDNSGEYYGFKIKFLKEITASSSNQVTIEYSSTVNREKLYAAHAGNKWTNTNYSTFCYNIGTTTQTSEEVKFAYDEYTPGKSNLTKTFIGYDESTGEMIWYLRVNEESLITGEATITEYIPEGQTFSSADFIYAERGDGFFLSNIAVVTSVYPEEYKYTYLSKDSTEYLYFKNNDLFGSHKNGNSVAYTGAYGKDVYVKDIAYGSWSDGEGHSGQKVTISLAGLEGYEYFLKNGVAYGNGTTNTGKTGGPNWNNGVGEFTLRIKTRLSGTDVMELSEGSGSVTKTYTNSASFSQGDEYIIGAEDSATGTISKVEQLLTKSAILSRGPAYAQFSLDINPTSQNIMDDGGDPVTVYDVMGSNMTLATDHVVSELDSTPEYFDVFDVSKLSSSDLYDNGEITEEKMNYIRDNATNITSKCTIEDVTGQSIDGISAGSTNPTYKITVPDETHVVVLYWTEVEGTVGQEVNTTNEVNFYYGGKVQKNSGSSTNYRVRIMNASSTLFAGPYFKVHKTNADGEALEGATFAMYKYVADGEDELYMSQVTDENGIAYFGHRTSDNYEIIKEDTLYYLVETEAPEGYALSDTRYYFEFKSDVDAEPVTLEGVDVAQLAYGSTYTAVNNLLEPASEEPDPEDPEVVDPDPDPDPEEFVEAPSSDEETSETTDPDNSSTTANKTTSTSKKSSDSTKDKDTKVVKTLLSQTGDYAPFLLIVGVVLLSGLVVLACALRRRRTH